MLDYAPQILDTRRIPSFTQVTICFNIRAY